MHACRLYFASHLGGSHFRSGSAGTDGKNGDNAMMLGRFLSHSCVIPPVLDRHGFVISGPIINLHPRADYAESWRGESRLCASAVKW